jgi:hypothetical protein
MQPKGFALTVDDGWVEGDLWRLESGPAHLAELGYDAAEIPVHGVDAIRCGQRDLAQAVRVRAITRAFPLCYTVAGPGKLNVARHPSL